MQGSPLASRLRVSFVAALVFHHGYLGDLVSVVLGAAGAHASLDRLERL